MAAEVTVRFGPTIEYPLRVGEPGERATALAWLEQEFVRLEAEPLRASGKVLTADKVLAVAMAAGASRFASDPKWAATFAANTVGALGRDAVTVEIDSMSISF